MRTYDDRQTEVLLLDSLVPPAGQAQPWASRGTEVPATRAPDGFVIPVAVISDDDLVAQALRARLRGNDEPGPLLTMVDDPHRAAVLLWDARRVELDEGGLPLLPEAAREPVFGASPIRPNPPRLIALIPDADIDPLPLLAAGVHGLVARDASPSRLSAAIEAVHRGLTVLDEDPGDALIAAWSPAATARPVDDLTPREREVLTHLAEGLSNRTIAEALGISAHTVKFHVDGLLDKLGARSRTHAVVVAVRRGLLDLV